MKTSAYSLIRALLLGLSATGALFAAETAPTAGRITVIFSQPEKYTDVKDNDMDFENERGREHYLPLLGKHLEQLAARQLPEGQKLTVTFSDVDLAGDFEPWRGARFSDIRIVKDMYVPRMILRFTLADENGKVLKEGERTLVDLSYQMRITSSFPNDPVRYEKDMLRDWVRKEFPARQD